MPNNQKKGGKPGYIGRITNAGAQRVEAPIPQKDNGGKVNVRVGDDLRIKR